MSTRSLRTSIALLLCFLFSALYIQAQESRRVRPAFPIAAGEKMLVIPGDAFSSSAGASYVTSALGNEVDRPYYRLELPVGTTLKRLVVEAAESDDPILTYMTFYISRVKIRTFERVVVRSVTTQGYSSGVAAQFVSNPANHVMLQGWVYFVEIAFAGGGGHAQQNIHVVKVIYEP